MAIAGVWLANMKDVPIEDILDFKESLSVLLISRLFIILAARLDFAAFTQLGFGAIMVLLTLQFVARPAKVFISTYGTDLTLQEKAMLSWLGPRGIVAAAISALFALRLQEAGMEQDFLYLAKISALLNWPA